MRFSVWLLVGCLSGYWAGAQSVVSPQKVDFANKVLQQIGATYGFTVLELPKLVMFPKEKSTRIAYLELAPASLERALYSLDRSRLLLDEDLYDVCMNLDKSGAALAFVLSHEMAHFYLRHASYRSFAESTGNSMSEVESHQQESEADRVGLLFAYLAGYEPESHLNALFDQLYKTYKLNPNLPGYPSKSERQRVTRLRASEFQTYGNLFAVGQALYCRGLYAEAARCFEYVFTKYPLKEAYNNFGVCRLQQIVRFQKLTAGSYFVFPFEIDPRNRLLQLDERGNKSLGVIEIAGLLKEANEAFEQALKMDPRYQRTYLNQAMAHLLADNPYLALGTLEKMDKAILPNTYLLRGIAYCNLTDFKKAQQNFALAIEKKAYQADYNLRIYNSIAKESGSTPIRQPWQFLQTRSPTITNLHCEAQALSLQETEEVPTGLRFRNTLLELNTPPPFLVVNYEKTGLQTYFQVKLKSQANLYFVRNPATAKPGR